MEPFFRPKNLPTTSNQPAASQALPADVDADTTTGATKSETKSDANETKQQSQVSSEYPEEPRTPHSRAKNVARFYPVTKDASVVKPDVGLQRLVIDQRGTRHF